MGVSKSRIANVSKNLTIGIICQIVNLVVNFVARTFFLRLLGTDYLGVNGLFTNILSVLSFAELGIGHAIIAGMYKPLAEGDEKKLASLMRLYKKTYLIIGIIIAVAGICVIPFLNFIIKEPPKVSENLILLYVLFLANTVVSYFFTYKKSIVTADQRNYIILLITEVIHLIQIVLQLVFLFLTNNYIVYLVIQICATLAINLISSLVANKLYPYLKSKADPLPKEESKKLFNDVKSLAVYKFGSVVLNGTDNILVSSLNTITNVGLVSNYMLLNTSCNAILGKVNEAFTSSVGNLNTKSDPKKQLDIFHKLFFITAWLYGFVSVGLLLVTKSFITAWIGEAYLLDDLTALAIVLGFYVTGVHYAAYTYRITLGYFSKGKIAPLAAAVINIGLSIGFYFWFGLSGIFFATPIARLITTGIVDPVLIYKNTFKKNPIFYYIRYFVYFAAFAAISYVCSLLISLVNLSGWGGVCVQILIVTVTFNGIMLLLFGWTKTFRGIVRSVISVLMRKKTKSVKKVESYLINREKTGCMGCKACESICPKKCIGFEADSEGFEYPVIDHDACIDCGLCKKVCPVDHAELNPSRGGEAYVGVYNDLEVVQKSSSGGAFTAVYEYCIENGYIVYGVRWADDLSVEYNRAVDVPECEAFRKSKYIQADTNDCFDRVYTDLQTSKGVLFSGNPCVCSALKNYLNIKKADLTNLFIVDIVCHGVVNQSLFDRYLEEQKQIVKYSFRNKENTDTSRSAKLTYQDGNDEIRFVENDPYLRGYYTRLFYRPACGTCMYANPQRVSDLTLGDAWGVQEIKPQFDPLKGCSLVLVNTLKGSDLLKNISDRFIPEEVDYNWAVNANEQLHVPTHMHKNRGKFFKILDQKGFQKSVFQCTKKPVSMKFKEFISPKLPKGLKKFIKRIIK